MPVLSKWPAMSSVLSWSMRALRFTSFVHGTPPGPLPIHGRKSRVIAPPPLLKLPTPFVLPELVLLLELKMPPKRKLAWRMTFVSEVSWNSGV